MDLKAQYQSTLKEQVVPQFKQEGFTIKSINCYTREVDGMLQKFSVYGRVAKGSDCKSFTFELSLYASNTDTYDISPTFYCRFGHIQRGRDHWYYLYHDNYEQLSELVALDIRQFAIPFFNGIKKTDDIYQLIALREKVPLSLLPLALKERFPGMGRDYEKEFLHVWKQIMRPLAVAAGFREIENVFYRFPNNVVVQAFYLQCWMTNTKTFMNLEGMLSFFVKSPEQVEIPPLNQPSSGWIHISSAYVITGKSSLYNRYTLSDYTPEQMHRLVTDDWNAFILPFFERLKVPEVVEAISSAGR